MHRVLLAVLLGCVIFVNWGYADTTWVNTGAVSGVWTAENSPYIIQTTTRIEFGDTLRIGPGVEIRWTGGYVLEINGCLHAEGTAQDSIFFHNMPGLNFMQSAGQQTLNYCVFDPAIDIRFDNHGVRISHCRFEGNHTVTSRIEVFSRVDSDTFYFADCVIEHFQTTALTFFHGILLVDRTRIRNNTLPNSGTTGGGLYLWGGCHATLTDCWISDNQAPFAAAMELMGDQTSATLIRCRVTDNNVSMPFAGGILVWPDTRLTMTDCEISRNGSMPVGLSGPGGGAIAGCTDGGDNIGGKISLTRCVLSDNAVLAGRGSGGAIYGGDSLIIRNCTIVYNWAERGGAIFGANHLVLQNSILDYNVTGNQASAVIDSIHESATVGYCDFGDFVQPYYRGPELNGLGTLSHVNINGDSCDTYHNLFVDAQFVDTMRTDYRLLANSPCIDAGNPASPQDSDGTVADMGAYAFQQTARIGNPSRTEIPTGFELHQNCPNPFNNATRIAFDLSRNGPASLMLFDINGRQVRTLVSGDQEVGHHEIVFDGAGLASGMYLVRLQSERDSQTIKAMLLK